MNINKLKTIRKGLKVERLHTIPHVQPYNNGFHSANAALIALELCKTNNVDYHRSFIITRYMLLHDVAEGYTGDIPANVKWDNPHLAGMLESLERDWGRAKDLDIPTLPDNCKAICKVADLAELGFYAVDEIKMGNSNMYVVSENVIDALNKISQSTRLEGVDELITYIKGGSRWK